MRRSSLYKRPRTAAFTLIELLVVIGIIALLISILLPALSRARRSAYQVKCASNMRQIATAMLQYINDNKGAHPPVMVSDSSNNGSPSSDPTNPWPDGWFWASELMHQHYIPAPNMLKAGTSTFYFDKDSPFRCPEGLNPEEHDPFAGTSAATLGSFPRDQKNSIAVYGMANNPRLDGAPPYAICTWYQLCCISSGSTTVFVPGGANNAPFIFFDKNKNGRAGAGPGLGGQLVLAGYTRKITQVKHSSVMCMIAEAEGLNWLMGGTGFNPASTTVNGETMYLTAIAGRHGKSTSRNHAMTNIAFFDGHVGLFDTKPISTYVNSAGQGGAPNIPQSLGVVFTISQDQ